MSLLDRKRLYLPERAVGEFLPNSPTIATGHGPTFPFSSSVWVWPSAWVWPSVWGVASRESTPGTHSLPDGAVQRLKEWWKSWKQRQEEASMRSGPCYKLSSVSTAVGSECLRHGEARTLSAGTCTVSSHKCHS